MNAVLDIIIVLIIIFCVVMGYRNGFIKTVLNFLTFIIAFVMAKTFSPQLSDFIYSGWVKPNFVARVTEKIENLLGNVSLNHMVKDPNRPDDFINMLEGYGFKLPNIEEWISEAASKGTANVNEFVATKLVEPLAEGMSYFFAFTAILLAAIILFRIIAVLINKAFKLPGLNLINKTGGIILGIIYGMAASYIFVFLCYYVLVYLSANAHIGSVPSIINDTVFYKWFYEHSPVDYILNLF